MLKLVLYIVILMTVTSYVDAQTCSTLPSAACSTVLDMVCSARITFPCMPSCDKCGERLDSTFIHEVCDSMESTNEKCDMLTDKCIEQCEGAGSVTHPEIFTRSDRTVPRIRSRIPITRLVVRPTPSTAMTTMTTKTNTMASSGDNDKHADDGDDDNTAMIAAIVVVLAIIVVLCIVAAAWYLLKKKSKDGRSNNDPIAYTADNLTYEGTGEVHK